MKKIKIFDDDGWCSDAYSKPWYETVDMLAAYLLKLHKRGITIKEGLLLLHDAAGAAANTAANQLQGEKEKKL